MSVPLRLLGLLLTAVGLVVATTGLVLLVHPLDSGGPAARSIDEAGDAAPDPDSQAAASRSPLPVAASPGVPPSAPPPMSPPRAASSDAGDREGTAAPDLGARSPTVTTVSHPAGPTPSSEVSAPSRPQSESPAAGPTASPPPPPAPSSSPPDTGVASGDEDRDEVQGSEDPCRHAWPWSGRRGSRGRGQGWGPPLPCDDRSVGAGAHGTRPPAAR